MTNIGSHPETDAAFSAAPRRALPLPFDSPEGAAAYLAAYDANMQFWPVPFEPLEITTRFGRTHLVASGPAHALSLVLLHSFGGALTMWWPNIANLSEDYRVYAVDVVGQAGKSIPDQPIRSCGEYVEWLTALLDVLGVERTDLVGMSYGGWLTLNYAIAAPERVRKIVLLSPAGGFVPLVEEFYERAARMTSSPTRALTDEFMRWLAWPDVPRDPVLRARYEHLMDQFYLGVRHFRGTPDDAVVPPGTFSDDELRSLRAPTLLLIGARDPIYDPAAALDRARRLLPSLEGALVRGSGHLMSFGRAAVVDARLRAFLQSDHRIDRPTGGRAASTPEAGLAAAG